MRTLLAIPAVLVLAVAGCGSDSNSSDSGSSNSSSASESTTSTPATPAGGVTANAVAIKGFAFNPAENTVKVGQRVTWTNEDSTEHNVIADSGEFKSPDLKQGDKFSFTAKKAGTFSYICTYHPQMKATLTVTS
jgi:plastocyanin